MAGKNNANIGFEKQIWSAACELWGHIPAADYRKVIVGLIFLRYISCAFEKRYQQLVAEGADMIDVGGYSSRPGCDNVSPDEEMRRLATGLEIVRRIAPDAIVSVDTFRASVARRCVEEYGVQIINDISAGELDPDMYDMVATLRVPYIMMHMRGIPSQMMEARYLAYDNVVADVLQYFAAKIERLTRMGVNDIIIDPGFGFGSGSAGGSSGAGAPVDTHCN